LPTFFSSKNIAREADESDGGELTANSRAKKVGLDPCYSSIILRECTAAANIVENDSIFLMG